MESQKITGLRLSAWRKLIPYLSHIKKEMLIVSGLMVGSALLEAAYPLFTRYAVDNFVVPGKKQGLLLFSISFFAVILLVAISVAIMGKVAIVVEMRLNKQLKRECFSHLQKLPLSYYNQTSTGYIIARVMSDTERICGMVSWGLANLAWSGFYIVFSIVFMFVLSAKLALMVCAIIPILTITAWYFQKKIVTASRRVREINSLITGSYNEGITGSKASKTLVIEDVNCEEFSGLAQKMRNESYRASRLNAMMIPIVVVFGAVAVASVLYRGGILTMRQLLDFGVLSAFFSYAFGTIEPITHIAGTVTEIISAQVGLERVTALLAEEITIDDTDAVKTVYGGIFDPHPENWEKIKGDITFENVSFKYPDGSDYVLENFSLEIPRGTTVAIVGETGAGKSTIVNLVCRFFEPTSGRILIDGKDYRERSLSWLHASLGYVLQDPHLFSGTIADNIRYGRLDATAADIERASKLVSADVVVARMDDGYDTQVGEGGGRLSTGEKQLVSFARAIIADPPIFVLDEATSSIDTETERLIQNAISHILKGRTSFIIAHRLSTISHADIILVVDDGKIIEQGTHDQLMSNDGHYAHLTRAMRIK